MSGQESASLAWRPEHLRLAIDAACVALWSWNVDSNRFTMDERAFDLWGLPWSQDVEFETLSLHRISHSRWAAFPDIFCLVAGRHIGLQVKKDNGRPRSVQHALETAMAVVGS